MSDRTAIQVYFNRRMLALVGLGFASGLPLMLTGRTLRAWMVDEHVDVTKVGLMAGVALPYSLKFLWAPLMDRFAPAFLGRQRGWLIVTQVLLLIAISALGLINPAGGNESLLMLGAMAVIVSFFSASQDVVADGYRTAILPTEELGAGAAVFVSAYRMAMVGSGAGALILASHLSWRGVYLMMAGLMGVGILATLIAPEPQNNVPPKSLADAVIDPIKEFWQRCGAGLLTLILFAVLFKLPETIAATWYTPLLQELKYSKDLIGVVQLVAMFATIPGAIIGGAIAARLGLVRSLWIFGILGSVSNAGFYFISTDMHLRLNDVLFHWLSSANLGYVVTQWHLDLPMIAVITFENFCSGLVAAGFLGYLMSQCNPRYSTTQFALLTGMMAFSGSVVEMPMGYAVKLLGYQHFFLLSVFTGLPGLLLLLFINPAREAKAANEVQVDSADEVSVAEAKQPAA